MSLELKAIALLVLIAGVLLGYTLFIKRVEARGAAACEARHDAADAAALRRNLEEQETIRVEANRMSQRARDVSAGLPPLIRRVLNAAAQPCSPPSPGGGASAPSLPDVRSDVLGAIETRLAGLALEADLRGAAGRACEQSYDSLRK